VNEIVYLCLSSLLYLAAFESANYCFGVVLLVGASPDLP
jgi:hypothetical protein